ncbi:hypothetical protein [Kitasatospora sp. DSM 101779]|uniref:hypothetical protein n=1 Tax=Kitasatospora sp. DSM 101779 TaxID=2853165 RepID=UPI0021D8138B|nr:hypothetical protein [Kitasatospora sp. DSM 101779]
MHTYDAQLAVGAPQQLPQELARRRRPGRTSGPSWTSTPPRAAPGVSGSPSTGALVSGMPAPGSSTTANATAADEDAEAIGASLQGTAHEPVLALHGRMPPNALKLDGDRGVFDQLVDWHPER